MASAAARTEAKALVAVFIECGEDIDEAEFSEWYSREHAPARLTLPTFITGARYKATDGQTPSWLTLYDLTHPAAANDASYRALETDEDRKRLPKLEYLSRRVYNLISHHGFRNIERSATKHVLAVSMEADAESEEEFNHWYEEEHMPLISEIPGWLRGRRYVLDPAETSGRGRAVDQKILKYLALHEFERDGYQDCAAWKKATSTKWRAAVMEHVVGKELRQFALDTVYLKR